MTANALQETRFRFGKIGNVTKRRTSGFRRSSQTGKSGLNNVKVTSVRLYRNHLMKRCF